MELAKLYEHQKKDFEMALEMTRECIEYLAKMPHVVSDKQLLRLAARSSKKGNENNSEIKYFPGKRTT